MYTSIFPMSWPVHKLDFNYSASEFLHNCFTINAWKKLLKIIVICLSFKLKALLKLSKLTLVKPRFLVPIPLAESSVLSFN